MPLAACLLQVSSEYIAHMSSSSIDFGNIFGLREKYPKCIELLCRNAMIPILIDEKINSIAQSPNYPNLQSERTNPDLVSLM